MKPKSTKRAAADRAVKPLRDAFRAEFPLCWLCNRNGTYDVHEIVRGGVRHLAVQDRRTWFATCRPCHELLGDYGKVPVRMQFLIKMLRDFDYFDLEYLCELRGEACTAHTFEDMADCLSVWVRRVLG